MKTNKIQKSWIAYDWANSAYALIVMTAILPLYFKSMASDAGITSADSTAYWGYANSFATLLVSILSPILGTMADYKDKKKRFFSFFFLTGVIFAGLLATVPSKQWMVLLSIYVLSNIGFAGANIFYDAFIVDVAKTNEMDSVSTKGYAYGYIGSTIPFILSMIVILKQDSFGLTGRMPYQIAFLVTACWWGLFTIPFFKNVNQVYYMEPVENPVSHSFSRIRRTIGQIRKNKSMFFFLIAYFFYIDGVHTIIRMAAVFGSDLNISADKMIVILLSGQFIAFPAALIYGKIAERVSAKKVMLFAIATYIGICFYAFTIETSTQYWILAALVMCTQGGIQSLSRSYFGKLVPKEESNEYFGFYNIFGKFAAILGPLLLGIVSQVTGNSKNGVLSLIILFALGFFFLYKAPQPDMKS